MSPILSPSPPISPLSPATMNDGDQLSNGGSGHSTRINTATAKRIWVRQREERPTMMTLSIDDSSALSSDDVEEILNGHLNNSHEDLMDVTLSEMMNKHLMMLSEDGDDNSEGEVESSSQGFVHRPVGHDLLLSVSMKDVDIEDADSDTSGGELNPADTTIANQTFIFMSALEREFDQQAISPGVPSLLEETIPMNNFADMTFMDYGRAPDENDEGTEPEQRLSGRILLPVLRASQAQSAQEGQAHGLKPQRTMLLPLDIHRNPILDEFLTSLPSLPLSPELQVSGQFSSQSLTAQVASPPPPRLITLPAPIITSREQCHQLLERKTGRAQRPFAVRLQEQSSPSPVHTPGSDSNESVFSTPLTSYPPTSAIRSQRPISTYGSPREDFALSFPTSAGQELDTIAIRSSVAFPKKAVANVLNARPKNDVKARAESDQQPLDMIIIRPMRLTSLNVVDSCPSSPWSSLSSASSNSSSTSSVSSWSWSWSSSSSKTTESTNAPPSLKHRDHKPRLPTTSCSHPLLDIRSRSMSSLMKHQNGWLGFQVLDIRLMASGRNHIVVVTKSNQVYSCCETDNDHTEGLNTTESSIEDTLGRSTRTENGSGFIQDTTHQPGLVEFTGTDWQPITLASIVKVVCSDHGTFVLTENGDLWGWGSFEDSQGKKTSILKDKASSRPIQICPQKI
ncbi:hypothetical protein BGZ92_010606, partial [Podila epicladia]